MLVTRIFTIVYNVFYPMKDKLNVLYKIIFFLQVFSVWNRLKFLSFGKMGVDLMIEIRFLHQNF